MIETVYELNKFAQGTPDRPARSVSRSDLGNVANQRWGSLVMTSYISAVNGEDAEPLPTVLADMLADLMHLADVIGADFDDALDSARDNYRAEIEEEN